MPIIRPTDTSGTSYDDYVSGTDEYLTQKDEEYAKRAIRGDVTSSKIRRPTSINPYTERSLYAKHAREMEQGINARAAGAESIDAREFSEALNEKPVLEGQDQALYIDQMNEWIDRYTPVLGRETNYDVSQALLGNTLGEESLTDEQKTMLNVAKLKALGDFSAREGTDGRLTNIAPTKIGDTYAFTSPYKEFDPTTNMITEFDVKPATQTVNVEETYKVPTTVFFGTQPQTYYTDATRTVQKNVEIPGQFDVTKVQEKVLSEFGNPLSSFKAVKGVPGLVSGGGTETSYYNQGPGSRGVITQMTGVYETLDPKTLTIKTMSANKVRTNDLGVPVYDYQTLGTRKLDASDPLVKQFLLQGDMSTRVSPGSYAQEVAFDEKQKLYDQISSYGATLEGIKSQGYNLSDWMNKRDDAANIRKQKESWYNPFTGRGSFPGMAGRGGGIWGVSLTKIKQPIIGGGQATNVIRSPSDPNRWIRWDANPSGYQFDSNETMNNYWNDRAAIQSKIFRDQLRNKNIRSPGVIYMDQQFGKYFV